MNAYVRLLLRRLVRWIGPALFMTGFYYGLARMTLDSDWLALDVKIVFGLMAAGAWLYTLILIWEVAD
jgi:hypothetical protein